MPPLSNQVPQAPQVPPVAPVPPSAPVPSVFTNPPVAPQSAGKSKSSTGLIIIVLLVLILIGGGIFAYLSLNKTPNQIVVPPVATSTDVIATTTDVVIPVQATTTVITTISTTTVIKVTPKPVVIVKATSTVKQVAVVPDAPKQVVQTPVKVPGTWQNDSKRRLCWDGFQSACQEALTGYNDVYDVIDVNGDGSVLLGAVEYCKYLDPNGRTLDKTIQNFWRLPTMNELVAKFNSDQASFHYLDTGYWSSTITGPNNEPGYLAILSDGSVSQSYMSKGNHFYVRCIQ